MAVIDRVQPYVDRVIDDRDLQRDLREAISALRSGLTRAEAKRRKPTRLIDDRKFKASAQRAAASLRDAGMRFQGEPPKRHRGRKLLLVVIIGGAGFVAARKALEQGGKPLGA
jgi:hypothetical protein